MAISTEKVAHAPIAVAHAAARRSARQARQQARLATPISRKIRQTQHELDALPLDSGIYRVAGIRGLYVRCLKTCRSFYVQRKVDGKLRKKDLGAIPMKDALTQAAIEFEKLGGYKPAPGRASKHTFAQAFHDFIRTPTKKGKPKRDDTVKLYRRSFNDPLVIPWHNRPVRDIGTSRQDLQRLHLSIMNDSKGAGIATSNQIRSVLCAVYNFHRDGSDDGDFLPSFPKKAFPFIKLDGRKSAFADNKLVDWFRRVRKLRTFVRRCYYIFSLLTGARPRSVENVQWPDINVDANTIFFRIGKEGPYTVPMSATLRAVLLAYRDVMDKKPKRPGSEPWLFPSPGTSPTDRRRKYPDSGHLVNVNNWRSGIAARYDLRHTFSTTCTNTPECKDTYRELLMGHYLKGVAGGYIADRLLFDALERATNAVSARLLNILGIFDPIDLLSR